MHKKEEECVILVTSSWIHFVSSIMKWDCLIWKYLLTLNLIIILYCLVGFALLEDIDSGSYNTGFMIICLRLTKLRIYRYAGSIQAPLIEKEIILELNLEDIAEVNSIDVSNNYNNKISILLFRWKLHLQDQKCLTVWVSIIPSDVFRHDCRFYALVIFINITIIAYWTEISTKGEKALTYYASVESEGVRDLWIKSINTSAKIVSSSYTIS